MTLYDWTYCRSCHAKIYWLTNETTGKAAPIDVQPPKTEAGAGNIEIDLGRRTYRVVGKQLGRHTSHFQTCPSAAIWKRHGGSGFRGARGQGSPKKGGDSGE